MNKMKMAVLLSMCICSASVFAGELVPHLQDSLAVYDGTVPWIGSAAAPDVPGNTSREITLAVKCTPSASDILNSYAASIVVLEVGGTTNGCGIYITEGKYVFYVSRNARFGIPSSLNDTDISDGVIAITIGEAIAGAEQTMYVSYNAPTGEVITSLDGIVGQPRTVTGFDGAINLVGNRTVTFLGVAGALHTDPGSLGGMSDDADYDLWYAFLVRGMSGAATDRAQIFYDAVNPILMPHNPAPANGADFVDPELVSTLEFNVPKDPSNINAVLPNITGHYVTVFDLSDGEPNGILPPLFHDLVAPGNETAAANYTFGFDEVVYWHVETQVNGAAQGDPNNRMGPIWKFSTVPSIPVFTGDPENQAGFSGEMVQFSCVIVSKSPASVAWYKEGSPEALTGTRYTVETTFEGEETYASTLTITGLELADEGSYYCEATNEAAVIASSAADLVVKRIVGHWPLDADSTWTDLSASGNDLELYLRAGHSEPNSFSYVTGVDGLADGAVEFDGTWSLGTMKADGTMNDIPVGDAPYSISLWFKTDNTNIDYLGLMGWGNYGTNFAANALAINNGLYGVRNYWWGRDLHAVGDTLLTDNNWHHLVATYDGDVRTIYLDGLAAASDNPGPHAVQTSENFRLGKTNTLNLNREWYRGVMDEVKVYNYAISDVDVAMEYTSYMGGSLCIEKPVLDLDDDCVVGLGDLAMFAASWLNCGLVPDCIE